MAPIVIDSKNDVVININNGSLTCPSLTITNGSLSVAGTEGGYYNTEFKVENGITVDKGVLTTPIIYYDVDSLKHIKVLTCPQKNCSNEIKG